MAFAAVLTALGYYIILRRFCQGLLKFFFAGRGYGGKFSPFAACQPPPLAYFPAPRAAFVRPTPGERTISNAAVACDG